MYQRQNQEWVLDKISKVLNATAENQAERLLLKLDQANRIFIAGVGRSKLVGSFLAMRLMHAGYTVYMVGEVVTPRITDGDLLVMVSGSGETEQLVGFARRAILNRAQLALLTASPESSLASLSNSVIQIGSSEVNNPIKGMPMGTVFELSALCFLEALFSHIVWEKQLEEVDLHSRHANLE